MENIQHFSHRHPLTLVLLNKVDGDLGRCKICYQIIERVSDDGYGCKECGFYIHKSCVVFPNELQHPSHPKHLLLLKLHRYEDCANCNSNQFDFKYKCPHCHEFYLCPECAFLPLTKKVENHDHPLTLIEKLSSFMCDHCLKGANGMLYFCLTCSFMVHSKCTSSPSIEWSPTIQAAIHSHSLTLHKKIFSFTCDACGNEGKEAFYFCATCLFVAHLDCALLPSIVKVKRHKHPLNLIYSLPADQSKRRIVCQLCAKTVDTNYWLYCCSSHDFVAHLHCATKKEEIDETFVPNSKEDHNDKSIDLLPAYIVKKTKSEGDGTEIHTEIEHFSHEHDLQLTDHGSGIDKKCDGCIRSICPPFYECAQCEFFLHKSCVELPTELRSSLHRHPLKLIFLGERKLSIICDACRHLCNGFVYHCAECDFDLDVQCSSIPDILKVHPSHKYDHQLILANSSEYNTCSSCGSKGRYNFSCVDCKFTLDFKCLTRPRTMNYENHDHPFTLCYTLEDDSGEYYCDICEKERDPKSWFYYCADCSYPTHPECILGNHPRIKFGKTFKFDFHQHPLTLVEKTHAKCSRCGSLINEGFAYECAECNFIVHCPRC
ncbi:hypothetical protein F2P56_023698 [Juglans regia]|uniref:Phorbol-ester/DAG-type domain-containing protein n=2 Tax=Juglans regia TaxID=51240 RepID=A0A833TRA8_JUGRE|nr:uncharacterized protein LOC109019557 [Juglans regia]KAF5453996.1 hypothetical protein F2P56_023698 [Juglans regia]